MVSRAGADLEDGRLKLSQRELALKVAQAVLAHKKSRKSNSDRTVFLG
jgi:hypothetical protein